MAGPSPLDWRLSPIPEPFEDILFKEWWDFPQTKSHIEEYRHDLIACDFCGFCNIVCPVFLKNPWQSLSPRGRILLARGLLTGEVKSTARLKKSFSVCTDCQICDKMCPKEIPISDIVKICREEIEKLK